MKCCYFILLSLVVYASAVERILFSVKEEEEVESLVGILLPKLSSRLRSYKDRMNFQIIQKGDARYFRITPQDGRITLAQVIDREAICQSANMRDDAHFLSSAEGQCQLRFTVSVLREGTSEIIEMVQVTVNVLDINDNQCRFEPSDRQTVYIPEDTPVDSNYRIPLYIPTDPDAAVMNRIDLRSITLKSADDIDSARYFDLQVTGTSSNDKPATLHLLLTRKLDYETLSVHKLIVTASDASRQSSSTCSLHLTIQVVDVNDHPPRFAKKIVHLSLNENTPVGSLVHQLQASDQDKGRFFSKLIYSLGTYTPEDVRSYFDVHPYNGSIVLKQRLSYGRKRKFEIPVVVRNPTDAEIKRNNNEKPQLKISNDIQVETTVHDTAQVIIGVIDINDEAPAISFYAPSGESELWIEENVALLPSDFGVVSVTDGDSGDNGKVECTMADNFTEFFRLVRMTSGDGMTDEGRETLFKLSAIHKFDREERTSIGLTIICRDFGSPPKSSSQNLVVKIRDLNDNSPVFDRDYLEINVTEDSDPSRLSGDYVIGRVLAHDPDDGINAEITYDLIQSNVQNLFIIDPKTGVFSSNGELDREMSDRHQFVIVARDSGVPQLSSSITVTVHVEDFNDEPPVFALPDFEFMAVEGTNRNTLIGTVEVSDADLGVNRELSFRLLANDLPAHYPISSSDSLQHYNWKSEQASSFPYRLESRYNPLENEYEVSIFTDGELDAESASQHMEYSDNGSRTASFHSFLIVAEDGGTPKRISRARIIVHLLDINDNAPVFSFPSDNNTTVNVSYKEYVGFPFIQVSATDVDTGINGTVQYYLGTSQTSPNSHENNDASLFQIDRSTGQISLNKQLSLSDLGHAFKVYIIASDMSSRPLQTQAIMTILVDETAPKGANAAKVSGSSGFTKTVSDSLVSLFIIIFIVAAAFIISGVLLTAVCIVLNRSRRSSGSSHTMPKKQTTMQVSNPGMPPDLNNAHILPDMSTLPGSYTLAHAGGKVYHAIPLVSAERWSPTLTSGTTAGTGATLVYATMNHMMTTPTDEFGAPRFISGTLGEVHASTLPLFSSANLRSQETHNETGSPSTAYVTHPGLACEDAIWMGSQDGLFDKQEAPGRFEGPGSNDQDSGHGDSLDTTGTALFSKSIIQPRSKSPFATKSCLGAIIDGGPFTMQSNHFSDCSHMHGNSEGQPTWNGLPTILRQNQETKTQSATTEGCSTFI